MRKLIWTALAGAAVVAATPALAQDEAPSGRAPFTGARVEVLGGYDHVHAGRGNNQDGFVGGAGIGYDFQVGHFVVGVEGEATQATTKKRFGNYVTAGDRYTVDAGRDLYAGGRIGFATHGALLYAKGGYTNARYTTHYTAPGGLETINGQNLDGYRIGGGIEKTVMRNGFVKAEYRYSHYDTDRTGTFEPDRHQVVAGVGVRF